MLHLHHRKSVCQQIAGGAVPQIMQPYRRQIAFCHYVVKNAGYVVWGDGITVRPREHKIGLHIGVAEKLLVLFLLLFLSPQMVCCPQEVQKLRARVSKALQQFDIATIAKHMVFAFHTSTGL